jgi:hypothetical protein
MMLIIIFYSKVISKCDGNHHLFQIIPAGVTHRHIPASALSAHNSWVILGFSCTRQYYTGTGKRFSAKKCLAISFGIGESNISAEQAFRACLMRWNVATERQWVFLGNKLVSD